MKIFVSLLIFLAIVAGIRYVTNKPGPVDQELIAGIQDKIDTMQTGSNDDVLVNTGTDTDKSVEGDVYVISSGSSLGWIGRKVWGEHTGTIAITNASAIVSGNSLVGWEMVINMNDLVVSDLSWDMNTKLVWHLKDGFFDVANNPEARFVISKVTTTTSGANITGDLTLKGVTKSINFPATVTIDPAMVKISATTYIDKEEFGITEWAGMVDKLFGLVFDLTFNK